LLQHTVDLDNTEAYLTKLSGEIEEIAQHIRAYQSRETTTTAEVTQKDQIKVLKQKNYLLERQNSDLDYLITSGQSELRKELRILQGKIRDCQCEANPKES
jgi:hypothetical protein